MTAHPAGFDPGSRPFWIGKETEGCRRGELTIIVHDVSEASVERVVPLLRSHRHVFLTEKVSSAGGFWELVDTCLYAGVAVTIACYPSQIDSLLDHAQSRSVSLMVRVASGADISAGWYDKLRPWDQVSILFGMYDLVTFAVSSGVRSVPADYEDDRS